MDLLTITGLQLGSPEQRITAKSTSLCTQPLFCPSALISTQVCCVLMFLQYTDSSSEAKSSEIQLTQSQLVVSLLRISFTGFGEGAGKVA